MPRFNPPPHWPAPPEGWTPPPGWQPDPSWGPAPDGWQLWLPEPGDRKRPNSDAFVRAGVVAIEGYMVWVVIVLLVGRLTPEFAGAGLGRALVPWLVTALIAFFRRSRWGWGAYAGVFVGLYLFLTVVSLAGQQGMSG